MKKQNILFGMLLLFTLLLSSVAIAESFPYWRVDNQTDSVYINFGDVEGVQTYEIRNTGSTYAQNGKEVFNCFNDGSSVSGFYIYPDTNTPSSNGTHINIVPNGGGIGNTSCILGQNAIWTTRARYYGILNTLYMGSSDLDIYFAHRSANTFQYHNNNIWNSLGTNPVNDSYHVYEVIVNDANNGNNYFISVDGTPTSPATPHFSNAGDGGDSVDGIFYRVDGTNVGTDIDYFFTMTNQTNVPTPSLLYEGGKWKITIDNTVDANLSDYAFRIDGVNITGDLNVTFALSNPPVVNEVFINPSFPLSNETLRGFCNVSDDESDVVNASFRWYVNTAFVSGGTYENISLNDSVNIANLTGLDHNDEIIFSCSAFDGETQTEYTNSSSVTVKIDDGSPSSFTIFNPIGQTITLNSTGVNVYFSWGESSSPVNNTLTYDLSLWRLVSTELVSDLSVLNYTKTFANTYNGVYDVVVTAKDNKSNETTVTLDNGIVFCVNNWQEEYTTCMNSTNTRYYVDTNACPLQYDKPIDDMTVHPCYSFEDSLQNESGIPRSAWIFVFFIVGMFALALIMQNGILMFFGGVAIFLMGLFYLPTITLDRLSSVIVALFGIIIMFVSVQLSRKSSE